MNIVTNKTVIQQADDICPFFEVIKASCRNNTSEHVPASGLKDRLEIQINELTLSGAFTTDLQKRAFLDHLVTAPVIFTRGMSQKTLLRGLSRTV